MDPGVPISGTDIPKAVKPGGAAEPFRNNEARPPVVSTWLSKNMRKRKMAPEIASKRAGLKGTGAAYGRERAGRQSRRRCRSAQDSAFV
ncbi:hypothetical protein DXU03_13200 [Rhizobium johnstonii]